MIEHVPSTTAQKFVIGQQSNSMIKKQNKKRKYKVIYFLYTFYVLFYLKLKKFLWLCVKVVNSFTLLGQFIELHKIRFQKTRKINLRLYYFLFFLQHFEKLGINLTPKSIHIEEECGFKKHTECAQIPMDLDKCNTYNKAYLNLHLSFYLPICLSII